MQSCSYANLLVSAVALAIAAFAGCASSTSTSSSQTSAKAEGPTEEAAEEDPAAAVASAPTLDEEEPWEGEREAVGGDSAPRDEEAKREGDSRTMEVIQGVVIQNRQAVRDCYKKVLAKKPGLKGELVIHFVLDPAGKVRKAELNERSTLQDPEVAACSIKAIRAIQFPASSRGMESTVNYPFDLNP